jgi:hypothetical protein
MAGVLVVEDREDMKDQGIRAVFNGKRVVNADSGGFRRDGDLVVLTLSLLGLKHQ